MRFARLSESDRRVWKLAQSCRFQNYLALCPCMQELSEVSEAARKLAMSRLRLIQPYLEQKRTLHLIAVDPKLSSRTAQRWVSQYRKLGLVGPGDPNRWRPKPTL
jgi:hypothetical protein